MAESFFSIWTISRACHPERQRKGCDLLTAAKHNLREIQAELGAVGRINTHRLKDNLRLFGPAKAEDVVNLAHEHLRGVGINPAEQRKNVVQAIEAIFSLPDDSPIDPASYFEKCLAWINRAIDLPVLSCVAHFDEGNPHAHVLLLPLQRGKPVGGSPVNKTQLAKLREGFNRQVAAPAGLRLTAARLYGTPRKWAIETVLDRCLAAPLTSPGGPLWPLVETAIRREPERALQALNISIDSIRSNEDRSGKPIGFLPEAADIEILSCVGFSEPAPLPQIQTLSELWERVGCKASRLQRLAVAAGAVAYAVRRQNDRHVRGPQTLTMVVRRDDGLIVDRSDAEPCPW